MDDYSADSKRALPNKLGITDPEELKQAESAICHIRMVELGVDPVKGNFDLAHLQRIHERLLGDIYDFAGKIRTVDLSKDGSMFCRAMYIGDQ